MTIYFFVGTTAEFLKLAPVIKEVKKRRLPFKLVTSGQNSIQFEEFKPYLGEIKVNHTFKEKLHQSSIILFFVWAVKTFFSSIIYFRKQFARVEKKNIIFIVHGDTVSSLIGALVAKLLSVKLVHVEAGLRSFNFLEPFPEEICRFVINYISDVNFCQNQWSLNNLKHLATEKIDTKQNTLIELCKWTLQKKLGLSYSKKFDKYYILIIRRQEHIYFNKDWAEKVMKLVLNNADKNLNCLFVTHALTSRFLKTDNLNLNPILAKKLFFIPKLPYSEFMTLMNNAEFIATDGCTNQEDAYFMGLPCLILRNRTERIEGLGENVVLSYGRENVIKEFLRNYKKYKRKPTSLKISPSKVIVNYLVGS